MSKFRSASSTNAIFANNFSRKRKEKKKKGSQKLCCQTVSYVQSSLLNPYEPRPLQRRLIVAIVMLGLEEENQLTVIARAISPRVSKQRYYINRRFYVNQTVTRRF